MPSYHVLRCFDDDNITHVDGSVDPVRDKGRLSITNFSSKDLETVESRIAKTQNRRRPEATRWPKMQLDVLLRYKEALDQGLPARSVSFDGQDERKFARELFLLTNKPVLYVCNVDDDSAAHRQRPYVEAVREAVKGRTPRY